MTHLKSFALALLVAMSLPAQAQTLTMSGTIAYTIEGDSVVLRVDRVDYVCPAGVTGTSGTLRLSLWASATPYTGVAQPGYLLATYALGELGCNQILAQILERVAFTRPPAGIWYMTLMLEQFDGAWFVEDYLAFDETEEFGAPPPPPTTLTAVEYYHAGFGHYFVTAIAGEIDALDSGQLAGWVRTGETFTVYRLGVPETDAVCRFFTDFFTPRSSHFYTPYASECQGLQGGSVWRFEGEVFAVVATLNSAGDCPAGLRRLFRLYNDGRSGAPNHSYTTSLVVRQVRIDGGWVPEGVGALGVIGCVP